MKEFEEFCESLHGYTKQEINERVNREIDSLEAQRANAPARPPRKPLYLVRTKADYLKDIEQMKRLLSYVVWGTVPTSTKDWEADLFLKIVQNAKSDVKKST